MCDCWRSRSVLLLPLKKREFDLQHNVAMAGPLSSNTSAYVREVVSTCLEFKRQVHSRDSDVFYLEQLDGILIRWAQRDAVYRPCPQYINLFFAFFLMLSTGTARTLLSTPPPLRCA